MKLTLYATAALSALSLAACASIGTPSPAVQLTATKAFIVAEQGYDTAVVLADSAVNTRALPVATVQKIKTLVDTGHTYVVAGRTAVTAADSTTLASETAALASLASQITALIPHA